MNLYCITLFFFTLQTTTLKSGSLYHDIHYWLSKDTSQVSHYFIFQMLCTSKFVSMILVLRPNFLNRMKQVRLPLKQLNQMLLLEAEQYSIVKYRAMKQKSSHHILNHVLYHKKVELRLASNITRLRCTRHACLSAQENMLSM